MLIRWLKRLLFNYVIGEIFKGVTEYDFVDLDLLDGGERREYLYEAKEWNKNTTYQTELLRMKYMLERKIINKSKSDFDILIGKGQLALLDMIMKRSQHLADLYNHEQFASDRSA